MYACLTPNLRRTSPPRENTTRGHPLAISCLLCVCVCGTLAYPRLRQRQPRHQPDLQQPPDQPLVWIVKSVASVRPRTRTLCAPFTTTTRLRSSVALRYLRVFWMLRSDGLLLGGCSPLSFPPSSLSVSVSGPEHPFCRSGSHDTCDRCVAPKQSRTTKIRLSFASGWVKRDSSRGRPREKLSGIGMAGDLR